jgi:hypothetical protein
MVGAPNISPQLLPESTPHFGLVVVFTRNVTLVKVPGTCGRMIVEAVEFMTAKLIEILSLLRL